MLTQTDTLALLRAHTKRVNSAHSTDLITKRSGLSHKTAARPLPIIKTTFVRPNRHLAYSVASRCAVTNGKRQTDTQTVALTASLQLGPAYEYQAVTHNSRAAPRRLESGSFLIHDD